MLLTISSLLYITVKDYRGLKTYLPKVNLRQNTVERLYITVKDYRGLKTYLPKVNLRQNTVERIYELLLIVYDVHRTKYVFNMIFSEKLSRTGVAVQNVERSRKSKVSSSCQILAVHVSALWSLCREMVRTRARWKL